MGLDKQRSAVPMKDRSHRNISFYIGGEIIAAAALPITTYYWQFFLPFIKVDGRKWQLVLIPVLKAAPGTLLLLAIVS
jgi:murein endopeptidase